MAPPMDSKGEEDRPDYFRRIAVLTSGGDSAGMNAAVRSVIRMGIQRGCEMYVIREGWEGLVRGNETEQTVRPTKPTSEFLDTYGEGELLKEGEAEMALKGRHIIRVGWDDVRGFASEGGTLIGTARSAAFREYGGRTKSALNLVKHGIDALVVCGGDGSLTGADKLRAEWPEHLKTLLKEEKITKEQCDTHTHLNIVGLVGSIDNDMAGTDLTIGASTALHRICEAIDCIDSTASSHSRAFIVEVMGRHCGWLALMAGLSTGADYVFIPESPPDVEDWQEELVSVLNKHRTIGKRKSIIIVAEGAIDRNLNPIQANTIKEVCEKRLGLDTRVTTLGHTQRGGRPCAYDRILATLQGVEAVEAVLVASPEKPAPVIGLRENMITREPLMDAVKKTQSVAEAIANKDFGKAMSLRDPEFEEGFIAFNAISRIDSDLQLPEKQRMRIGIIHVGAPAGGMNAATRTAVRFCLSRGHTPIAIYNSFTGLIANNVATLSWLRVDQWTSRGGSELGTNRKQPSEDMAKVAERFKEHGLQGLLVIGGFEAFTALLELQKAKEEYPALDVPICHIPATISNNVPGTDFSLGSDTSVNVLAEHCDAIKQSASASRSRVFVVETQGGECGYIAIVGALAAGAVVVYTPEIGVSLKALVEDVEFLKRRYESDTAGRSEGRIVIRSERSSKVYTTEVISNIFLEEGGKLFDSRSVNTGHTLQGGLPTPRDRTRAVRLAIRGIKFLERHGVGVINDPRLAVVHALGVDEVAEKESLEDESPMSVISIRGAGIRFLSLEQMVKSADMKHRRGLHPWWLQLKSLIDILSGRKDLKSHPLSERTLHYLNKIEIRENDGPEPGVDD